MRVALGVDGGGSKTRALVEVIEGDGDGRVVGAYEAASSNPKSVGVEAARRALTDAARGALAAAGVTGESAAACFGVAGLDREEDRAAMETWARAQGFAPPERTRVVHDAELVLAAGTPEGWGLGLVCGTGSVAFGASRDGRRARAGGWGWLMGDEGSGYALGVDALRTATQHADGRRTDGARLLAAVMQAWDVAMAEDLIARAYAPETTRAEVAKLAGVALRLADEGDGVARQIVDGGAAAAALLVTTVARSLGAEGAPLAVAGGLVAGHAGYRAAICARAGVVAERVRVVDDPARGALVLARRSLAQRA